MKELGLVHQSSQSQVSPLSAFLLPLANLGCPSVIVLQVIAPSSLLTLRLSLWNVSFKAQFNPTTP